MAGTSSEEESGQSDEEEKTEEHLSDVQGHQFHIEEEFDEELPESQDNGFDKKMTTLLSQDSLGTLHDQGVARFQQYQRNKSDIKIDKYPSRYPVH